MRKGCRGHLEIAILPQFLTIEPHFVRKGCAVPLEIAILPQFLTIEPMSRPSFWDHWQLQSYHCPEGTQHSSLPRYPGSPLHSLSAKGLRGTTLEIAIFPLFLTIEPHFVRKGCADTLEIAIFPQFLTIEPHFVRKCCADTLEIAIFPQFLTIELHFLREGCVLGVSLPLPRLSPKERKIKTAREREKARERKGADVREDVDMSRCEDEQM